MKKEENDENTNLNQIVKWQKESKHKEDKYYPFSIPQILKKEYRKEKKKTFIFLLSLTNKFSGLYMEGWKKLSNTRNK